ncbi:genetic competence negative regulator [Cytobacillus gottheilii]|uniref:Genetic competence negative regulator n=1 Tax=Cytobacillus gottheilii TaxID=859144 RepID=A0ABX8F9H1_9BACI|nr:genetic competence negative regulator [Cytobacillus gottheilii]QVY60197.1 genetic competence negative regulator [Cytobacillus gottheilii]
MRLERLNYNKIKIFLSLDDLIDKGLTKEDIWKDSLKWHQLFHEMLEEASETFGFEIHGSVAVEIFSVQAQGMIMIVTMEEHTEEEELLQEGFVEMQVTIDSTEESVYEFNEFDDIILLAGTLYRNGFDGGSVYYWNNKYFCILKADSSQAAKQLFALTEEYGSLSSLTSHYLLEYGKPVIKEKAIQNIHHYFHG